MIRFMLLALLAAGTAGIARALEPGKRAEVMLLGSHHLANNDRDLINPPVENVLTGERQQEIVRLVEGLALGSRGLSRSSGRARIRPGSIAAMSIVLPESSN